MCGLQIQLVRDVEGSQFADALNETLRPRMALTGGQKAGLQRVRGASSLTLLRLLIPFGNILTLRCPFVLRCMFVSRDRHAGFHWQGV
jgi:hypothetical protein